MSALDGDVIGTRYHQICTKIKDKLHYTIDRSINTTSRSYKYQDKCINIKFKPSVRHEYEIYNQINNNFNQPFVLKHTFHDNPDIPYLIRHHITSLSVADIYGVIKYGDWNPLYKALKQVNWFKFETIGKIISHTKRPQHTCCLTCRIFLAELGLFMHKLHKRVSDTIEQLLTHYNFILTSDNVDLNGILDFEDYQYLDSPRKVDIRLLLKTMVPYLSTLYSFYEHVGMYFITQPIYKQDIVNQQDLLIAFEQAVKDILLGVTPEDAIYRPSLKQLVDHLHLDVYAIDPYKIITAFHDLHITIPDWCRFNDINLTIRPRLPVTSYVDANKEIAYEDLQDTSVYFKISYENLENFKHYLPDLERHGIQIVTLYVENHPIYHELNHKRREVQLIIWIRSMYDANVNLSHFDSISYDKTGKVSFPILGEMDATMISQCDKCKHKIPEDKIGVYEAGTNIHAYANIKPNTRDKAVNPLLHFDTALHRIGEFQPDCDYVYGMKTKPEFSIDFDICDYFKNKHGLNLIIPPAKENPEIHNPETTFTSDYYIKTPSVPSITEDLNMFNQNTSGSMSPTVMLMAMDMLHQLLEEEILASDGLPNCPMVPDQVLIRNKHKSSGSPYRKWGDSELMRNIYAEHRNDLVYHKKHAADQHLTLVINKVAISTKHRDRTILAININKSELGRALWRWLLDKIKYTANKGGPILIGLVPQYGGWDNMYKQLYKDFPINNENVKLGGKDYPKWDRRINNNLQFITSLLGYSLIDPITQHGQNQCTPNETWYMFMAETTQIIYDYLVFGNELYQKPGGVTSGNSRTADGNSFLHLFIDFYATIMQLIQSTPANVHLERDIRDELARIPLTTMPSEYLQDPYIASHRNILHTIRKRIAKGAYLSDDGLLLHRTDIIDYDDFMHESLLLSTYDIPNNRHKYHQDPPQRCAREFLSQDTFYFGDMVYPLPEFGRIYSAILSSDNKNVYDPSIYLARLLSLYSYLYIYYFYLYEQPEHKIIKFLDAMRGYIDELMKNPEDETYLDSVPITLDEIEHMIDFRNNDIFEVFDQLYGFNKSSEYPNYLKQYQHRYKKLSYTQRQLILCAETESLQNQSVVPVTSLCYLCGANAHLTCAVCHRSFCNTINPDLPTSSHITQHFNATQHKVYNRGYKNISCKICNENDITKLYNACSSNLQQYFCIKHKGVLAEHFRLIQERHGISGYFNICAIAGTQNFYLDNLKHYNLTHCNEPLSLDVYQRQITKYLNRLQNLRENQSSELIRCTIKLCSYGIVRPYYQALLHLTLSESKSLDNDIYDVNILQITTDTVLRLYVNEQEKFDLHSTYYLVEPNGNEKPLNITYDRFDGNKRQHIWIVNDLTITHIPKIRRKRLNILTTILRTATRKVPLIIEQLLSWQTKLSETTSPFPTFTLTNGNVNRRRLSDILNLLNKRRFQIIFGGPGTGKSTLLAELCCYLHGFGKKILIYTPSHQSANALLHKIARLFGAHGIKRPGLVRIVTDHIKDQIHTVDPYITYRESMTTNDRIVITTIQSYSTVKHISSVDLVILDEFSLTSDNYLVSSLAHLTSETRILFTGDPRQLSTVDPIRQNLPSVFHSLINYYTETYPDEVYVLKEHYRCHPKIFELFKNLFYPDKNMICCAVPEQLPFLQTISVLPVPGPTFKSHGVVLNSAERDIILAHVQYIKSVLNFVASCSVAIICSYQSQLQDLQSCQRDGKIPKEFKICTIDSSQGDEFDLVILCLTQINTFTLNFNRFNVAISRAKKALILTLPPKEGNNLPIQQVELYEKLEQLPYSNSNPLYLNQSQCSRHLNIRNDIETLYPENVKNIVLDDLIYLDTEFLYLHSESDNPVILQYGFCHKDQMRSITGKPVTYYKINEIIYSEPIKFNNARHQYTSFNIGWLKHKEPSLRDAALKILNDSCRSSFMCDAQPLLNYCKENIHVRPTFVTFAGLTDIKFIFANSVILDPHAICSIPRCGATPIYARMSPERNLHFCAYHASHMNHLTHFVNPCNYDISFTSNTYTLTYNGKKVFTASHNFPAVNLSSLHKEVCNRKHIFEAHQSHNDAKMTQCLFEKLCVPKLKTLLHDKYNLEIFTNMHYRLRNYNPELCKERRLIQAYWYEQYSQLKRTHCNMGSGASKLQHALCNIDISYGKTVQNDMNTHQCESQDEIYFDSHWYKTTKYNKNSYIFFDNNPSHYYMIDEKLCLYLNSKYAVYIHPFEIPTGADVFSTLIPTKCTTVSQNHSIILPKVEHKLIKCIHTASMTSGDLLQGTVCTAHYEYLGLINQIYKLVEYGYAFVYKNLDLNNQNLQSFDPRKLTIPGYENRPRPQHYHMIMKAHGVYKVIQKMTPHLKFTFPINPIFFGAASVRGLTPMSTYLQDQLKVKFINVDPRLLTNDEYNKQQTIEEFHRLNPVKTNLIISDVHNNDNLSWLEDLYNYTKEYLIEDGMLIFKITSRAYDENILSEIQKSAYYLSVEHFDIMKCSSELWIAVSYRRSRSDWYTINLPMHIKRMWYNMQIQKRPIQ